MKRLWIAAAMLALVFAAAMGSGVWANNLTGGLIKDLEQAQTWAEEEHWERAAAATQQAYQRWTACRFPLHALMRHGDTDQIYLSFRAVQQYLRLEELDQYAAANVQLIGQLELLARREAPTLENIL